MPVNKFATAAAVVIAAARFAHAGSLTIKNSCSCDINVNQVNQGVTPIPPIKAGSSSAPLPYLKTQGGEGTCFKITPTSGGSGEPMQFEYSFGGGDHQVWYDLSNIDGYPDQFMNGGVTISPSKPNGNSCSDIDCPAGVRKCHNAYNVWDDDQKAMRNCDDTVDLTLHICSGGQSGSGGNQGSGQSQVQQQQQPKASTPAPVPAAKSTPSPAAPYNAYSPSPSPSQPNYVQAGPSGNAYANKASDNSKPAQAGNPVVQETHVVYQYVNARDAEPEAAPEPEPAVRRRHEHHHHARRHA